MFWLTSGQSASSEKKYKVITEPMTISEDARLTCYEKTWKPGVRSPLVSLLVSFFTSTVVIKQERHRIRDLIQIYFGGL